MAQIRADRKQAIQDAEEAVDDMDDGQPDAITEDRLNRSVLSLGLPVRQGKASPNISLFLSSCSEVKFIPERIVDPPPLLSLLFPFRP